jgi:hypothetical protein
MIDRIKKIIAYKNLSATQFSDEIEIQRSSLSHVLSGRNKPSLDFMLKIKHTYPEIELDWLLMGKGEMVRKKEITEIVPEKDQKGTTTDPEINFGITDQIDESSIPKASEMKAKVAAGLKASDKKLSRVLLFYTDHTFESFDTKQ